MNDAVALIRDGGRVIVVEYDRRVPSRWVPYPIHASHWPQLAAAGGNISGGIGAMLVPLIAGALASVPPFSLCRARGSMLGEPVPGFKKK